MIYHFVHKTNHKPSNLQFSQKTNIINGWSENGHLLKPSQGQLWQISVFKLHIHYWEKFCNHFKSSKQVRWELKIQMFPHQNYKPFKDNHNLHSLKRPLNRRWRNYFLVFSALYAFQVNWFFCLFLLIIPQFNFSLYSLQCCDSNQQQLF